MSVNETGDDFIIEIKPYFEIGVGMRYLLSLLFLIATSQLTMGLSICHYCVERSMVPYCDSLSQAGLLQVDVQRLTFDKDGRLQNQKGKVCEFILAERDRRVARLTHYWHQDIPTPKTFCRFLVTEELIAKDQQKNCEQHYLKAPLP